MRTKLFAQWIRTILIIAILAFSLGVANLPSAQAAKATGGGATGITSAQDGAADVSATRPWTALEMKNAIPMDLALRKGTTAGTAPSHPTDLVADGPSGAVAGSLPGGKTLGKVDFMSSTGGVSTLGYAYPAPFTRFYVRSIANTNAYPFRAAGKLFFFQKNAEYPNGANFVCSASVAGTRGIITAGHCVHGGDNNATHWSTNMVFVPAYANGAAPYGQWAISNANLLTFTAWYANGDLSRDWGAARVNSLNGSFIGNVVGSLGFAWNYSRVQSWWLLGYPQGAPFTGAWQTVCTSSFAYNSPFGLTAPIPMGAGCDQTGGSSGGPWVMAFGTGNYINGVNSHIQTNQPNVMFSPYADASVKTVIYDWQAAP